MKKNSALLFISILFLIISGPLVIPCMAVEHEIGNVSMVSDANDVDCEAPKLIEHENYTFIFWMEGNKTICYSNHSGLEQISTIFEEDGLNLYDIAKIEDKLFVCFSIYTDTEFLIKYRIYDFPSQVWGDILLAFSDQYVMKLGQSILSLMVDVKTSELYLAWTYCCSYDGKERSCIAIWNELNGFTNIKIVSEVLFRYHGVHQNRAIYDRTYYYVINVLESSNFRDYLMSWSQGSGETILESYNSQVYKFLFNPFNNSLYKFRIHSSFLELSLKKVNFELIFNTTNLDISKSYADVSINASNFVLLGYAKSEMGRREVYFSIFDINGTIIQTKCISSPLQAFRESLFTVHQELSVSGFHSGSIVWVDRTLLTGKFCYNVFQSGADFELIIDPVTQLLSHLNAWWIIPALIGGLVLYLYFSGI